MAVNRDKPNRWKADIAQSVDAYNDWFLRVAPDTYRSTRVQATEEVQRTLEATKDFTEITVKLLRAKPEVLSTLRMAACPPLAVDRLIGLAQVPPNLVEQMEKGKRLPPHMSRQEANRHLGKIANIIGRLADKDILVWLGQGRTPTQEERYRAATIVADRLCGTVANPILRNAQEDRQLTAIKQWLEEQGYANIPTGGNRSHRTMDPGTFTFHLNVPAQQEGNARPVNIPVDAVIMPKGAKAGSMPLLIETKSAGDFANVNKRRKEEAVKAEQLRNTYGRRVRFILFLGGYFDTGYLGYEAAENIDWVWEHRIADMAKFGL